MMKQLKRLALITGLVLCFSAVPAEAIGVWGACDTGSSASPVCADAKDDSDAMDIVMNLINIFLYIIGILSVIMIIHSGFKYITSRGDSEQVKSAKNTLLYSVMGLIVAMSAFIIVNFVVGIFLKVDEGGTTGQTNVERGGSA